MGTFTAARGDERFDQARASYSNRLARIDRDAENAMRPVKLRYLLKLEELAQHYQTQGLLDQLLLVKDEKARFGRESSLAEADFQRGDRLLLQVQTGFHKLLAPQAEASDKLRRELHAAYLRFLETHQKQLTQAGDIDGAVAVRDEIAVVKRRGVALAGGTVLGIDPNGLLLHYEFEQISADRVMDRSEQKNHARAEALPLKPSVSGGNAARFQRASSVVASKPIAVNDLDAFTVCAWFKQDEGTKDWQPILSWDDGDGRFSAPGVILMSRRLMIRKGNGKDFSDAVRIGHDDWHHIVWVHAEGRDQVWLDGHRRLDEVAADITGASDTFRVGGFLRHEGETPSAFTGLIDDVLVFDRALDESEILAAGGATELVDWTPIFRSGNPRHWNHALGRSDDDDNFALPLDRAPDYIRYLRLRRMDTGEAVIINLSRHVLGATVGNWNGAPPPNASIALLGVIRDFVPINKAEGRTILSKGDRMVGLGYGFGVKTPRQAGGRYEPACAWSSRPIPPAVMEISVKALPLTDEEQELLLER